MKKTKKAILDLLQKDSKGGKFESRVLNLALQKLDSDSFELNDDAVYTADGKRLVRCLAEGESFTVAEGVKAIGEMAFRGKKKLRNVIIPSTVEEIGRDAFYDCDALDSVYVPASVTSVKAYAFAECDSLRTVTFAGVPAHLNRHAFDECDQLSRINVPAGAAKAFRKALRFIDGDTDYIVVEQKKDADKASQKKQQVDTATSSTENK